jgi:hypothetical protein
MVTRAAHYPAILQASLGMCRFRRVLAAQLQRFVGDLLSGPLLDEAWIDDASPAATSGAVKPTW